MSRSLPATHPSVVANCIGQQVSATVAGRLASAQHDSAPLAAHTIFMNTVSGYCWPCSPPLALMHVSPPPTPSASALCLPCLPTRVSAGRRRVAFDALLNAATSLCACQAALWYMIPYGVASGCATLVGNSLGSGMHLLVLSAFVSVMPCGVRGFSFTPLVVPGLPACQPALLAPALLSARFELAILHSPARCGGILG